LVHQVRIRNRVDCCGHRLALTNVEIGGKLCGQVGAKTSDGKWYTVVCKQPIRGDFVKLVTTVNEYLSISGIEVFGQKN